MIKKRDILKNCNKIKLLVNSSGRATTESWVFRQNFLISDRICNEKGEGAQLLNLQGVNGRLRAGLVSLTRTRNRRKVEPGGFGEAGGVIDTLWSFFHGEGKTDRRPLVVAFERTAIRAVAGIGPFSMNRSNQRAAPRTK